MSKAVQKKAASVKNHKNDNRRARDLRMESLESRQLLSVTPIGANTDEASTVFFAPADLTPSASDVPAVVFSSSTDFDLAPAATANATTWNAPVSVGGLVFTPGADGTVTNTSGTITITGTVAITPASGTAVENGAYTLDANDSVTFNGITFTSGANGAKVTFAGNTATVDGNFTISGSPTADTLLARTSGTITSTVTLDGTNTLNGYTALEGTTTVSHNGTDWAYSGIYQDADSYFVTAGTLTRTLTNGQTITVNDVTYTSVGTTEFVFENNAVKSFTGAYYTTDANLISLQNSVYTDTNNINYTAGAAETLTLTLVGGVVTNNADKASVDNSEDFTWQGVTYTHDPGQTDSATLQATSATITAGKYNLTGTGTTVLAGTSAGYDGGADTMTGTGTLTLTGGDVTNVSGTVTFAGTDAFTVASGSTVTANSIGFVSKDDDAALDIAGTTSKITAESFDVTATGQAVSTSDAATTVSGTVTMTSGNAISGLDSGESMSVSSGTFTVASGSVGAINTVGVTASNGDMSVTSSAIGVGTSVTVGGVTYTDTTASPANGTLNNSGQIASGTFDVNGTGDVTVNGGSANVKSDESVTKLTVTTGSATVSGTVTNALTGSDISVAGGTINVTSGSPNVTTEGTLALNGATVSVTSGPLATSGTGTVNLTSNAAINGATYTATGAGTVTITNTGIATSGAGTVAITDGQDSVAYTLDAGDTLTYDGTTIYHAGPGGATLTSDGTNVTGTGNYYVSGTYYVADEAGLNAAIGLVNAGTIDTIVLANDITLVNDTTAIDSGKSCTIKSEVTGGASIYEKAMVNNGTLTIDSTVNSIPVAGSGTFTLDSGSFTTTSSYLEVGTSIVVGEDFVQGVSLQSDSITVTAGSVVFTVFTVFTATTGSTVNGFGVESDAAEATTSSNFNMKGSNLSITSGSAAFSVEGNSTTSNLSIAGAVTGQASLSGSFNNVSLGAATGEAATLAEGTTIGNFSTGGAYASTSSTATVNGMTFTPTTAGEIQFSYNEASQLELVADVQGSAVYSVTGENGSNLTNAGVGMTFQSADTTLSIDADGTTVTTGSVDLMYASVTTGTVNGVTFSNYGTTGPTITSAGVVTTEDSHTYTVDGIVYGGLGEMTIDNGKLYVSSSSATVSMELATAGTPATAYIGSATNAFTLESGNIACTTTSLSTDSTGATVTFGNVIYVADGASVLDTTTFATPYISGGSFDVYTKTAADSTVYVGGTDSTISINNTDSAKAITVTSGKALTVGTGESVTVTAGAFTAFGAGSVTVDAAEDETAALETAGALGTLTVTDGTAHVAHDVTNLSGAGTIYLAATDTNSVTITGPASYTQATNTVSLDNSDVLTVKSGSVNVSSNSSTAGLTLTDGAASVSGTIGKITVAENKNVTLNVGTTFTEVSGAGTATFTTTTLADGSNSVNKGAVTYKAVELDDSTTPTAEIVFNASGFDVTKGAFSEETTTIIVNAGDTYTWNGIKFTATTDDSKITLADPTATISYGSFDVSGTGAAGKNVTVGTGTSAEFSGSIAGTVTTTGTATIVSGADLNLANGSAVGLVFAGTPDKTTTFTASETNAGISYDGTTVSLEDDFTVSGDGSAALDISSEDTNAATVTINGGVSSAVVDASDKAVIVTATFEAVADDAKIENIGTKSNITAGSFNVAVTASTVIQSNSADLTIASGTVTVDSAKAVTNVGTDDSVTLTSAGFSVDGTAGTVNVESTGNTLTGTLGTVDVASAGSVTTCSAAITDLTVEAGGSVSGMTGSATTAIVKGTADAQGSITNGTWTVTADTATTTSGTCAITAADGITEVSAGTVVFSGTDTFDLKGTAKVKYDTNSVTNVTGTNGLTFATRDLTKIDGGTVTVSATDTFDVTNATVQIDSAAQSMTAASGTTVTLDAFNEQISELGDGETVTINAGALALASTTSTTATVDVANNTSLIYPDTSGTTYTAKAAGSYATFDAAGNIILHGTFEVIEADTYNLAADATLIFNEYKFTAGAAGAQIKTSDFRDAQVTAEVVSGNVTITENTATHSAMDLTVSGGTTTLNADYTGNVEAKTAGSVIINDTVSGNVTIGSGTANKINANIGGTLDINGGTTEYASGTITGEFTVGAATLNVKAALNEIVKVDGNDAKITIDGVLTVKEINVLNASITAIDGGTVTTLDIDGGKTVVGSTTATAIGTLEVAGGSVELDNATSVTVKATVTGGTLDIGNEGGGIIGTIAVLDLNGGKTNYYGSGAITTFTVGGGAELNMNAAYAAENMTVDGAANIDINNSTVGKITVNTANAADAVTIDCETAAGTVTALTTTKGTVSVGATQAINVGTLLVDGATTTLYKASDVTEATVSGGRLNVGTTASDYSGAITKLDLTGGTTDINAGTVTELNVTLSTALELTAVENTVTEFNVVGAVAATYDNTPATGKVIDIQTTDGVTYVHHTQAIDSVAANTASIINSGDITLLTGAGDVTINGTTNADTISATATSVSVDGVSSTGFTAGTYTGDLTINGAAGADTIGISANPSSAASVTINGDAGNDAITVTGATTNLTINGGDGDDTITVNVAGTTLVVNGDAGNDIIYGSTGAETIHGGAGNDVIIGNGGSDTITGDTGSDLLIGGVYTTPTGKNNDWMAAWGNSANRETAISLYANGTITSASITNDAGTTLDAGVPGEFDVAYVNDAATANFVAADQDLVVRGTAYNVIVVTTTNDSAGADNLISLSEAISYYNTAITDFTIGFAVTSVIAGSNLETIRNSNAVLVVDGSGIYSVLNASKSGTAGPKTIDGASKEIYLLSIAAGTKVSINDLTLQNAKRGISNNGTLNVNAGVTVQNNGVAAVNVDGAGIVNQGTLNVNEALTVQNNATSGRGGGIFNSADGTITVATGKTLTISGNSAVNGGGLYNLKEDQDITSGFSITGNSATNGAGVYVAANTNLNGATINDNVATSMGGGIYVAANRTLTVTGTSTIGGNTATGNENEAVAGGGIFVAGTLVVNDTLTVSYNSATNGGGIYNNSANSVTVVANETLNVTNNTVTGDGGGIFNSTAGAITNAGTLSVTNNTATGVGGGILNAGTLTSTGTLGITGNTAANGGGLFQAGTISTIDQNVTIANNTANVGGGVYVAKDTDLANGTATAKIYGNQATLDATGDSGSGAAFFVANGATLAITGDSMIGGNTAAGSENVAAGVGGAIHNQGTVSVGAGNTLVVSYNKANSGAGIMNDNTLTVDGTLTVDHNTAASSAGGIYNHLGSLTVNGTLNVTNNDGGLRGGGIVNVAQMTLAAGSTTTVSVNTADNGGGGIHNGVEFYVVGSNGYILIGNLENAGTLNVMNNTVTATAGIGGGILNNQSTITEAQKSVKDKATFTNTGTLDVSGNTTGLSGGGIYNTGTMTLGGTANIHNNSTTTGYGGGIYVTGGNFGNSSDIGTLTVSTGASVNVYGNTSVKDGGGIFVGGSGTETVDDGTGQAEGAARYEKDGVLTVSGMMSVYGNTAATSNGGGIASTGTIRVDVGTLNVGQTSDGRATTAEANQSKRGGGLASSGYLLIFNGGIANINNNTAQTYGGGIYSSGEITVGGYYQDNELVESTGTLNVNNNTNTSSHGGGVYITRASTTQVLEHKGVLSVYGTMDINGNKAQATGANGGGIYGTNNTDINVFGALTVDGNTAANGGGGIMLAKSSSSPQTWVNDLIIEADGTLTVTSNTATSSFGGGIHADLNSNVTVKKDGTLTIGGAADKGNTSGDSGGGFFSQNTIRGGAQFGTFINSGNVTISYNTAKAGNGGGAYLGGAFTNETTGVMLVDNNTATLGNGGGIGVPTVGTFTNNGEITVSNNKSAAGNGGGMTVDNTLINNEGATLIIQSNKAAVNGGGVFMSSERSSFTSTGTLTVDQNTAGTSGGGICNNISSAILSLTGSTDNKVTISNNTAGGAEKTGGGIYNASTAMTLDTVTISGNKATGTDGRGGGIYNAAVLTNSQSNLTITGNSASTLGGGIFHVGTMNLEGTNVIGSAPVTTGEGDAAVTTYHGNTAGTRGGGILNNGNMYIISGTTNVDYNTAGTDGGGIYNLSGLFTNVAAGDTPTYGSVTVSNNKATGNGGGIYQYRTTLTLTEGTAAADIVISDNEAVGGAGAYVAGGTFNLTGFDADDKAEVSGNWASGKGAGIYNNVATFHLTNVTLDSNVAAQARTGAGTVESPYEYTFAAGNEGGGLYNNKSITVKNLTVTNNKAYDGAGIYNAANILTLTGTNTIGSEGNANNATHNGGGIYNAGTFTSTAANTKLTVNSNNANNGAGIYNTGTLNLTGVAAVGATPATVQITNNMAANDGGGVYNTAAGMTLTTVTIDNNTAANNGAGLWNSGVVTPNLSNLTVTNNDATVNGGGIYNEGTLKLAGTNAIGTEDNANTAANGAGIYNNGTMSVTAGTTTNVSFNTATGAGAGIYNAATKSFTNLGTLNVSNNDANSGVTDRSANLGGGLYNAGYFTSTSSAGNTLTVSANKANDGAGIYNAGTGTLDLNGTAAVNVALSDNIAVQNGGQLYSAGTANLANATLSGTADTTEAASGAGVYVSDGTTTFDGAVAIRNMNAANGAGVYVAEDGTLTASGVAVTIEDNAATVNGAGIYNEGTLSLTGTAGNVVQISDNTAANDGAGIYNTSANMTLNTVTIDGNEAANNGAGLWNSGVLANNQSNLTVTNNDATVNGGGIYNSGTLNLAGTNAIGTEDNANTAANGAGIYNNGTMSVVAGTETNVSFNTTINAGAGIYNAYMPAIGENPEVIAAFTNSGTLNVSNNGAAANGGGLYNAGTFTSTAANTKLTVDSNNANDGAGIYNATGATLSLTGTAAGDVTVSNNWGSSDTSKGGGIYNASTAMTLNNVTVNHNFVDSRTSDEGDDPATYAASTNNQGGGIYNSAILGANAMSNLAVTNNGAGVGGGIYNAATGSMALTGTNTISGNAAFSTSSVTGAGVDTKTYAAGAQGGGIYNAGTFGNTGTTDVSGNNAYDGAGIYQNGTMTNGLDANITIKDNTAANDGAGVYVNKATNLSNGTTGTIYNNVAANNGGAVYIANGVTLSVTGASVIGGNTTAGNENEAANGAGIYNNGTLDINENLTVSENKANGTVVDGNPVNGLGGGIYNAAGKTVTLAATKTLSVTANDARNGAGIYNAGTLTQEAASAVLSVTGNTATGNGGGIFETGSMSTFDSNDVVTGNAANNGAGIYVEEDSTVTLNAATIASNTATTSGGGLYVENDATLAVAGATTIGSATADAGNSALNGGGVYLADGSTLKVTDGQTLTFQNNTTLANGRGGALYIGAGATFGDPEGTFTIDKQSDFRFINNGDATTRGGAIYNAGTLRFACDYALGVTVTEDANHVRTIEANTEKNNGIGAIYNAGTMSNQDADYGEFYAGSAESSDTGDKKLSFKTFNLYIAYQNGDAIGNGDNANANLTLSNAKIFSNKGAGLVAENGTVHVNDGTEIGVDPTTSATTGYKYYTAGNFGANGSGVKVSGGTLTVDPGKDNAMYWNRWKSTDHSATGSRYLDYTVIDTVRISGNTGAGLEVTGGTVNLNDVRMEANGTGMDISQAAAANPTTVNTANVLISDWTTAGVEVTGGTAKFTNTTIAKKDTNASITNNGGNVTLNNTIAVSAVGAFTDASGKGTREYTAYVFENDVLGNKYTLGAKSVAANVGDNALAVYTDDTEIQNDLAGHDRILYLTVDLGAFENPVYWITADEKGWGWLDDVKTAVENVEDIDKGGAVKFDTSCNGATFYWYRLHDGGTDTSKYLYIAPPSVPEGYDPTYANIQKDMNIDSRYLDEDGKYYWMNVTLDMEDASGFFRVIYNDTTVNMYGLNMLHGAGSGSYGAAVSVNTNSAVTMHGMSFKDCTGGVGAVYAGPRNGVLNIVSDTADGYMSGTTAESKVESPDLYKLSVFEGNSTSNSGGAVVSKNTTTSAENPTTIDDVTYTSALTITGPDLAGKSYMVPSTDKAATPLTAVQYDADTNAVREYGVQFIRNSATDLGGALFTYGTVSLNGVTFIGNSASGSPTGTAGGGAMFVRKGSSVTMRNADFLSNSSATSGGAIFVAGTLTSDGNTVFAGNSSTVRNSLGAANTNGGAISVSEGTLTLNDVETTAARELYTGGVAVTGGYGSEFLCNEATLGGAIEARRGTITIGHSLFQRNLANAGGAVYNGSCTLTTAGGDYLQNYATDRGGAIFTENTATSGAGNTFNYNWASNGGAIWSGNAITIASMALNGSFGVSNNQYDDYYFGNTDNSGNVRTDRVKWDCPYDDVETYLGKAGVNKTNEAALNSKIPTATEVKLTSTGTLTEWDKITAKVTTSKTIYAGQVVTQTLDFDPTKFTAAVTSAAGVTAAMDADGVTLKLTFAADKVLPDGASEMELATVTFTAIVPSTGGMILGREVEKMSYDMNTDNKVDIKDLIQFAKSYNTDNELADFNADGTVNIKDLILFAKHYSMEKSEEVIAAQEAYAAQQAAAPIVEAAPAAEAVLAEVPTAAALETLDSVKGAEALNAAVLEAPVAAAAAVETETPSVEKAVDAIFAENASDDAWLDDLCGLDLTVRKNVLDGLFGDDE